MVTNKLRVVLLVVEGFEREIEVPELPDEILLLTVHRETGAVKYGAQFTQTPEDRDGKPIYRMKGTQLAVEVTLI